MLYIFGDLVSKLLYYDHFIKLVPVYNWLMLKSVQLDEHEKIWKST